MCTYHTCTYIIVYIIYCVFAILYIVYLVYLYIILFFIICVLSCRCHSVALWSFCHYNKFFVCVNIPGNKAHSHSLSFSLLLSHSFVALAVCFGSLSCWNTHPRPIFNALAGSNALVLTVHGPVHHPFDVVQLSCPLSRKTPPKHNVSTSMFDGGDGVLGVIGSIPSPPNTAS